MSDVCLALAWDPRGEHDRFRRLYPTFSPWYSGIVVSLPRSRSGSVGDAE